MSNEGLELISLQGINARAAGRLFLRDVNWAIGGGEQWAILGSNGSGKTLLADVLRSHHPISSGDLRYAPGFDPRRDIRVVSVESQNALCASDDRHDISEFAADAIDPGTCVRDLILGGAKADEKFDQLVGELGISTLLTQGVRFLSSGEMRKSLLAAALWQSPRLLILDNPLEGLDRNIRAQVAEMLMQAAEAGQQILLLARRPDELLDCISHVLVLDHGRFVAQGARGETNVQSALTGLPIAETEFGQLPLAPTSSHHGMDSSPLVELQEVDCSYGNRQVLQGASCTIVPGGHTCLSGANGAGKSTLLSFICGDNSRAYGQHVKVFGKLRGAGFSIWKLKRRIGLVSNALHRQYPGRTRVLDVLLSGFHDSVGLYEAAKASERRLGLDWLRSLGLSDKANSRLENLSFGDQRLLLIVRAVIKNPPLLVLDEPCSGLDGPRRQRILALVDQIAAHGTSTVLYVSHENDVMPRCIRQHLVFETRPDGSYSLEKRAGSPFPDHLGTSAGA